MRKKRARDTVELFVDIRKRRWRKVPDWKASCKMTGCDWVCCMSTELQVSKKWVRHFQQVHVAKFDKRT